MTAMNLMKEIVRDIGATNWALRKIAAESLCNCSARKDLTMPATIPAHATLCKYRERMLELRFDV